MMGWLVANADTGVDADRGGLQPLVRRVTRGCREELARVSAKQMFFAERGGH